MAAGYVDETLIGCHGPGDPPPRAVTVTETVLDAHGWQTVSQLLAHGDGCRRIVGMTQLADVHAT